METSAALERLDALIGRWRTQGWTTAAPGSAERIDAVDTYQRLPEIIGFDAARGRYVAQYFGTDGPNAYEATLVESDGTLVWTMRSGKDRFTGTFDDGRNVITGHWEALDDASTWRPGWTSR